MSQYNNTIDEHLQLVVNPTWNKWKKAESWSDHVAAATIGLAGEVGELTNFIKKDLYHEEKDRREEILLEAGDCIYYFSKLMELYGISLEELLEANKNKL